MVENDIALAKVHFIAGKGGVGKTLISRALSQLFVKKLKTLLVELSEDESGEQFSHAAATRKLSPNLSYVKIHPDQSLYEYLSLKIPSQRILDTFYSKISFAHWARLCLVYRI
ncbi:MAG TPA: ArsA-related P-loop ATPase [Myxococcota bacterium]|nr:ArsA-related P-loop ATPase [Myxococcota bacterium]